MRYRRIRQIMTRQVAAVRPDTSFKEVVGLLEARHIGAAPVVDDDGRVVGVVSETDLLCKESEPEHRHGWTARLTDRGRRWRSRRAAGSVARELMTTPAVTIGPHATLSQAAVLMEHRAVRHLPVVDGDGVLIGIVGRGDLLRVFLRPDAELRREIRHEVFERALSIAPTEVTVAVSEGIVTLQGRLERRSQQLLAVALTRRVDGVVKVVDRLSFTTDDT